MPLFRKYIGADPSGLLKDHQNSILTSPEKKDFPVKIDYDAELASFGPYRWLSWPMNHGLGLVFGSPEATIRLVRFNGYFSTKQIKTQLKEIGQPANLFEIAALKGLAVPLPVVGLGTEITDPAGQIWYPRLYRSGSKVYLGIEAVQPGKQWHDGMWFAIMPF
ncbi:hypothetical protein C4546_05065 [Candidatus Parcubacteria bacterium]|jgi:hypothetical protein|nr:MAG: hypothetical protein C4546_05065 [Candidatus Parcubacteria bacterium]